MPPIRPPLCPPLRPPLSIFALAISGLTGKRQAQTADTTPSRAAGVVIIQGSQPSSLPSRIPTTVESISGEQIERSINATDSEDALKSLPNLLVRKRYIGDDKHAVLSTRASGTGNSARSLVYADGVLRSYLLGNGAAFTPRWGMVTPAEIDRVDVLYGPFSAAYPGDSVGAVVDYVTRMPQRFEAHAKLAFSRQPYALYGRQDHFDAWRTSASRGDRAGAFSWWLNVNRFDSHSQPQTVATRLASASTATALRSGETPVSGVVPGLNRSNQGWQLLASGTEHSTLQDHLKAKLVWDLTPELRASYRGGWWRNQASGVSASWLRDAAGPPVDNTSGGGLTQPVAVSGQRYTLAASDFPQTAETLAHQMHALNLKSRSPEHFLADAWFDEFSVRGQLPLQAEPLWFKLQQRCEIGRLDWAETPVTGSATGHLLAPAVLLQVLPAATADHPH